MRTTPVPPSIPAIKAPPPARRSSLLRSRSGVAGVVFLVLMMAACIGSLPYTAGPGVGAHGSARYNDQMRSAWHLPPWWCTGSGGGGPSEVEARIQATAQQIALERLAAAEGVAPELLQARHVKPSDEQVRAARPRYWLGTDLLGRSLLIRCLAGGGVSLTIGLAAALLSVFLGTVYGAVSGFIGGRTDAVMMRAVDVLYGLPYILLVVLLAVASQTLIDEYISRSHDRGRWVAEMLRETAAELASPGAAPERVADDLRSTDAGSLDEAARAALARRGVELPQPGSESAARTLGDVLDEAARSRLPARDISPGARRLLELLVLLVAIGGVSWLTMARVVRGQVLSLKAQPFMEAARAMGVPVRAQFTRHLLPNLVGPITVYATLTVPQAILQESFLSFLGIGVRPPLPSWGNLAAEGLSELNPYASRWWLLLFPCLMLGLTLLALNFVGEALREAVDPRRARR